MGENIVIRLTKEEKEVIKNKAKQKGMNISQYIRFILVYADK